jgi:DNA-binding Lrp family transcriptional regulator
MTDAVRNAPIDGTDRRLLTLLRENARTPVAELARKLGLSRTTVQSRIERLERMGVITGYAVCISDDHERGLLRAHIMVTLKPKLAGSVEAALRRTAEVRSVYAVNGQFDLIVIVQAASAAALNAVIDSIGSHDGVERTNSTIVLTTLIDR